MTKPHYGSFFYLNEGSYSTIIGNVRLKALQEDIARGVKRLSEDAYCKNYGSTRGSLQFLTALNRYINLTAVRAELRYSQRKHFTLVVKTVNGYELFFKGVSGGYFGEGSRGC